MSAHAAYIGRFAPSPTGALHAGSLVAALASWLDARAHGGTWLVRIEDVDTPRCVPGADRTILQQLAACGLHPDGEVMYQSRRGPRYQAVLDQWVREHQAYPCACTRADIAAARQAQGRTRQRHADLVYPGTCHPGHGGLKGRPARAWRVAVPRGAASVWHWQDRRLGAQCQVLEEAVGDFVVRRAGGLWAYQLAVVVDDADQGVTDVVRGEDLADNTPRQQWLQTLLGAPGPRYLHTPLVLAADGQKLSKQNGAQPLDLNDPLAALQQAGRRLDLPGDLPGITAAEWLSAAVASWTWRMRG